MFKVNDIFKTAGTIVTVGCSEQYSFGNGDWTGVSGKGSDDGIIVKYDTAGNVVGKKGFGGLAGENFRSVTAVTDGIIAVGTSNGSSFGNGDWIGVSKKGFNNATIVKFDTANTAVWKNNFGGAGPSSDDVFFSVTTVPNGVIAAGYSTGNAFGTGDWTGIAGKGVDDCIIVKYDTAGNVVWKKNFGGSNGDQFLGITTVSNGIVAVGYSLQSSFGNGDWIGVTGKGNCDAIIVKFSDSIPPIPIPVTHIFDTICSGTTYNSANFTNLTQAGQYYDTLQNVGGKDSIIVCLNLTVNPTYTVPVSVSICQGQTHNFGGKTLTTSGVYYDTLTTIKGCDSIIVLTLTVNSLDTTRISADICEGSDYNFFGNSIATGGTYYHILQNIHTCDSVIELTLTVHSFDTTQIATSICTGSDYDFFGNLLTTSGVYYHTLQSIHTCDSVIELTLTETSFLFTQISASIYEGDSYTFGSQTLTTAGIYYDTLTAFFGCDSIVELTLTVNPIYVIKINASTITGDSNSGSIGLGLDLPNDVLFTGNMLVVFPSGFTLDEENTELSPNLTNEMKLSITPQANNTWELDIEMKSSIIPKQPKAYQDVLTLVYTVDVSVPDGIYTAHLKNLMFDFTNGGIANEADIPINITVKRTVGIVGAYGIRPEIRVFPNPTDGKLVINGSSTGSLPGDGTLSVVEVYDIVGQVVFKSYLSKSSPETTIDISHLANGMYFLKVDGKVVKVVKQ